MNMEFYVIVFGFGLLTSVSLIMIVVEIGLLNKNLGKKIEAIHVAMENKQKWQPLVKVPMKPLEKTPHIRPFRRSIV